MTTISKEVLLGLRKKITQSVISLFQQNVKRQYITDIISFSLDGEEQDKILVLQSYSPEFEANRKISIRTGAEVIEDHDADEGDGDYDDDDDQNSTNSNSSDPKGIKELVTL